MSGIIGGAGSKSGVVGETEIDYEVGTHTVAHAQTDGSSFTMGGQYILNYTKIGRIVHCNGWISVGSVTGSPAHTKFSLPFTCNQTGGSGTTTVLSYSVDYGGDGASVLIGNNQAFCQLISSRDNNSYAHIPAVASDEYGFSVTYETDA